jgi:hypothetical protein
MRLDLWNFDGNPATGRAVSSLREMFGADAWKIVKAGISVEEAESRYRTDGAAAVLEAADVMTALTRLSDQMPGANEPAEPAPPVQPPGPIDFS